METRFDHKKVEERIYKRWEKSGYFNPDRLSPISAEQRGLARGTMRKIPRKSALSQRKSAFCIIMPPPNANGPLHIGHAFEVTLQDLMIRFWRMHGRRTLWLPGADHAGFETQVVFDKKLEKEGRNRFKINRDTLWKEMWKFTQVNKKMMENQLRRLGSSCDWSREKFTLDPDIIKIVYDTFKKLYDDDLLYRDIRVVNWCPKHKTALSDLEVKYVERKDPLYYIKYGPLTLATVRPETKFGDTAIAVNPKDKRYQKYIGKDIVAQGVLGQITFKVIADEAVDSKFGTGVVKVTPAHDPSDFEVWQRHKGEIPGPKIVIDEDGRLTGETGPFKGIKVGEAREKVAREMKRIGILEKIDPNYVHQVATCYKCGTTLEPIPKMQWFVRMKLLAAPAIKAVEDKKIKIIPKRFEKIYLHWLKNIRDWNISRQILWGIRIPAWYCTERRNEKCKMQNGIIVSTLPLTRCPYCESVYIGQDPDVFDTWFSSGQWPFATLGFPNGKDFKTFYPTDVMDPGYEILFFWVARMVMLGLYRTGKIPFRTVFLHGMVRDKDRQKMSKSKGNVVDPLGVAEIYGADAIRIALIAGTAPGNDPVISEDKIRGYRNFVTKIWNIGRFIISNYEKSLDKTKPTFTKKDLRHLKKIKEVKKRVTKNMKDYKFHLAFETLYHYTWHELADKVVEEMKPRLRSEKLEERRAAFNLLLKLSEESLKMLHPFMPYVTEEIWRLLPGKRNLLMIEKW